MDIVVSAIIGDLISRSAAFVINKYFQQQPGIDKILQRLQRVVMRMDTVVKEAEGRHITSKGMLRFSSFKKKNRGASILFPSFLLLRGSQFPSKEAATQGRAARSYLCLLPVPDAQAPAIDRFHKAQARTRGSNRTKSMVLVAAGSVSVVKLIFSLAVAINAAASKARRNKADCLDIATRATTLDAALSSLEEPAGGGAKAKHPAVAAALEGLHLALHRALQAVMNCQEDGAVSRHVNADRVSAELRRVNQVITDRMMDVVLVAGLHTNSVVVLDAHQSKHRGAADGGSPLPRPLPQIQEASFPNSCKEEKLSATSGFNSFDFSELEGATNKFSEENLIGKSDSCTVYKGELPNGSEVAVKEYNKNQYKACRNECQNEENLAAKLLHKNILKLEGRCSSGGRYYQVYPYMHNRSLSKHIHGNGLPWPELFNIIRGIARGADYLHEQCGLGIIHLHLKPSSILLDYDYTPKICYFGNSKVLPSSAKEGVVDSVVRPCGFAAPEYIKSGRFSAKSDVYSFGVVLLELVTGWSRYRKGDDNRDERLNELVWEFWQNGREDDCVDPMLARATGRMGLQFQEMKRCINVALLCLEEDPLLRPDMAGVLRMLADNDNPMPRPQHPAYTT